MRAASRGPHVGQSLVEFAIAVGLLMFIICASFDAFQVVMTQTTVMDAARAAAHQAALLGGDDGPNGSVAAAATSVLASGLTTQRGDVTVLVQCDGPCQRYMPILVRVRYDDARWFPIFSDRLRVEQQAIRASEKDQSAPQSRP